jgi:hypothetical protein
MLLFLALLLLNIVIYTFVASFNLFFLFLILSFFILDHSNLNLILNNETKKQENFILNYHYLFLIFFVSFMVFCYSLTNGYLLANDSYLFLNLFIDNKFIFYSFNYADFFS